MNLQKPAAFSDPKKAVRQAFETVIKKKMAVKRGK